MNNTELTRNKENPDRHRGKLHRHGTRTWILIFNFSFLIFNCFLSGCGFDYYFNRAVKEKNPVKKVKLFSKALKNWKESDGESNKINTYINRGSAYGMLNTGGASDFAIADFNEALKYNANDPELYYNRAIIYYKLGKTKNAMEDIAAAIKFNPSFKEAYILRSNVYKKIGDRKKSENDLITSKKLTATDIYYNQGLKLFRTKDYDGAIKIFTDSLKFNPKKPEIYNMRGLAYIYEGKTSGAIKDFSKAIIIDPSFTDAYNNRGTVYASNKMSKEATADFKKAIQLKKEDPQAYYNIGLLSNNNGDFDSAISYFDTAENLSKKSPNPNLYYQRGFSYFNKENYKKAVADFSKVINLMPDNADAYRFRGLSFEKLGAMKKSNADLILAVKLNTNFSK